MRNPLLLSLIFLMSFGCVDDSPESSCTFSYENRIYAPFERVDFESDIQTERIALQVGVDLPVLVNLDDVGTFFYAPPNDTESIDIEILNAEQSCKNIELQVHPLSPKPEIVPQFMEILNSLNQDLPTKIGATFVPSANELGDDLSQADFAAGVMNLRRDELQSYVDGLSPEDLGYLGAMLEVSGVAKMARSLTPVALPPASALIPTSQLPIAGAGDLSRRMQEGARFCTVARSDAAQVANAMVLGAAASKNPVVGVGAGTFSIATSILFGHAALMCASHPEILSNPVLIPSLDLQEDADSWQTTKLTITAQAGPPVNLTGLTVGLGLSVLGTVTAVKDSATVITNFGVAENIMKVITDIVGLAEIQARTGETNFGGWKWENINIAGDEWVTVIPTGDVFAQQPCSTLCLRPLKVGSEKIIFIPKIGKFPYSTPELEITGTVHPITIQFGPPAIAVEPAQFLGFVYDVNWAIDPNLEWHEKTNFDPVGAVFDSTTDDGGIMGYMTPADESAYPVQITATSLSIGGLRAPDKSPPPRQDRALLVLDDLIAGPNGNCVSPGERQELFALASKKSDEVATIEWAPATLVQNGVFTAPMTPGAYTLTATANYPTEASVSEEVDVIVGECWCWTSVNGSLLNVRHDFDMRAVYHPDLHLGIVYINLASGPLVIQFPMFTDEIPEGSFMSGVSISADGT